ncbi:MAG: hypothetical protein H7X78_01755 [Methyloceanibacter sp.]|nr:hypothetical protein [Methyloceanibacter sp.]
MHRARFQWGGAATAAVLALLVGTPLKAADERGVRTAAEELGERTKPPAAPEGQQKSGLSDSAVRVLMTYAFSIIPDEHPGPDGKPVKRDKSDPNKFLIPDEDARRVIRAATRSAYAEACELPDLAQANYQALFRSESAKKTWTEQQLMMVNALFLFSASYFAGNVKVGDPDPAGASGGESTGASKEAAPEQESGMVVPKRPQCPPEQKQKVVAAINAFVQSAPPPPPAPKAQPAAPAPAQPAASGSN